MNDLMSMGCNLYFVGVPVPHSMIDCSMQIKGDIECEVASLLENNKALAKKVFGMRLIEGNAATKFFYWLSSH